MEESCENGKESENLDDLREMVGRRSRHCKDMTMITLYKEVERLSPVGSLKQTTPYDIYWTALETANFGSVSGRHGLLHAFLECAESQCFGQEVGFEYQLVYLIQMQLIGAQLKMYPLGKALKQVMGYLQKTDLPNRNYIESVIYNQLGKLYISKGKLGKAYHCCQNAKWILQASESNAWTAQLLELEAMFYLIQAETYPKLQTKWYDQAFHSYRLALEHSCQQPARIHRPMEYYLVQMLYIKMQMTKLMRNTLDRVLHLQYFMSSSVTFEDIETATTILEKLKRGWFEDVKRIEVFHLRLCELCIALRKSQIFILNCQLADAEFHLGHVLDIIGGAEVTGSEHCDVPTCILRQFKIVAEHLSNMISQKTRKTVNQLEHMVTNSTSTDELNFICSGADVDDNCSVDEQIEHSKSSEEISKMDRDYSAFTESLSGRTLPKYVQGYQPGSVTPKVYVDVDQGFKSDAEKFFTSACPELMAEDFIFIGEQEGDFSFLTLAAGTVPSRILSYDCIQHGSALTAISPQDLEAMRSDKNIKRIEDIPSAEIVGSLGGYMIDKQTNKLYVLTGWHPLKGQLQQVNGEDVICADPGSTAPSGDGECPVITESNANNKGKLYLVGSRIYGGLSSLTGDDGTEKAIDVAVIEATEEFYKCSDVEMFKKMSNKHIVLNVYNGTDKGMLEKPAVEKTGIMTNETKGRIRAVNRTVRIGQERCGGCFLVEHTHKRLMQFAVHGDSGSLVIHDTDDLTTDEPQDTIMAYGLCHSVHHKYTLYETGEVIDTTCCVRLDHCLKFLEERCQLNLSFVKPEDLPALVPTAMSASKPELSDSGIATLSNSSSDVFSRDTLGLVAELIAESQVYDVFVQLKISKAEISRVCSDYKDNASRINLILLRKWFDRSGGDYEELKCCLCRNGCENIDSYYKCLP